MELGLVPSTQWLAVRIHWSLITLPPQKAMSLPFWTMAI
jgi:hypothetical protein